jgi:hypothetical protein
MPHCAADIYGEGRAMPETLRTSRAAGLVQQYPSLQGPDPGVFGGKNIFRKRLL